MNSDDEESNVEDPEASVPDINVSGSCITSKTTDICDAKVPMPKITQRTLTNYALVPKKISGSFKTKADNALVQMFYKDFQPFNMVNDSGFHNFVHVLNPGYDLPSRSTIFRVMIPAKHE